MMQIVWVTQIEKIADFLDDEITNGFSLDNNLKGRYGRATFQRQQKEHLGKSVDWIKWALAGVLLSYPLLKMIMRAQ